MSRTAFVFALMVGITSPVWAAKQVTIDQLEQLLAADRGQSDGSIARHLRGLELTERASSIRLARWEAEFPGRHCHQALTVLADASAFLNLPASDIPPKGPPPLEMRREILSKAIAYVNTTITRLPNFYATRKTEHFKNTPLIHVLTGAAGPSIAQAPTEYKPLHHVGKSSETVSYHGGHELRNARPVDTAKTRPSIGVLTTTGEFGPILLVVLNDAVRGEELHWAYWEQEANGLDAVFRYSVPKQQSNYLVSLPHDKGVQLFYPAYHGEIAIDPATGSIMRILVVAVFEPPNEMDASSIQVEYGSISIGGKDYICPVKSVAISKNSIGSANAWPRTAPPLLETEMNDVAFTNYHLFRADARVLPANLPDNQQMPADSTPPYSSTAK